MAAESSQAWHTPPTPSRQREGSPSKSVRMTGSLPRGLLLPVPPNGAAQPPTPASAGGACLCTPADAQEHHTPPAELRRASLLVPPSDRLVRVARGSGVSVYRMDRSPGRHGEPRSPWALKKANISPLLVRERRRVERTLEHESLMLSRMRHPNIVGFRAAQRLDDGHVCLALEHCELSLYCLIQERACPGGGCVSPARSTRAGTIMRPEEIRSVGRAVAAGLNYLHAEHQLLHGDVKSANILLSRDLNEVKICDLGCSLPLAHDLHELQHATSQYEGTEPWRPPETLPKLDADFLEGPDDDDGTMRVCDRTDVFAFGLVLWEMLSGDVPHAEMLASGDDAYRAVLGSRPPLPPLPNEYAQLVRVFMLCTQHEPDQRPSAAEVVALLDPELDDSQTQHSPEASR